MTSIIGDERQFRIRYSRSVLQHFAFILYANTVARHCRMDKLVLYTQQTDRQGLLCLMAKDAARHAP